MTIGKLFSSGTSILEAVLSPDHPDTETVRRHYNKHLQELDVSS